MTDYTAPLRDMRFVLHELLEAPALWARLPALAETVDPDTADAILEEAAKVCGQLIAPLNRSGDEEGAQWRDGQVSTPSGFREAYATYIEGGWVGLGGNPAWGGMGMPKSLAVQVEEMLYGANSSFALYSTLTSGACLAIDAHASEALKARYLPPLYEGRWAGSMCLTEAHAGSDLGLIRTRAEPQADGSYAVSGSNPPWKPLRAFDDGEKVYIQFPPGIAQGELPPLFVIGAQGDGQLVNYRFRSPYYIVDRLFGADPITRWPHAESIYRSVGANADFKLIDDVGHDRRQLQYLATEFFEQILAR